MSWHTHESMNQLDPTNSTLSELVSSTFTGATITHIADAGQGRGVFSLVRRVHLAGAPVPSVVVKAPAAGANGEAARRSGSYSREAFAYRHVLSDLAVRSPDCYAVLDIEGDPWFVLEDLCDMRHFDQLSGLEIEDCLDLMWAEGPGQDFQAHGHFLNMSSIEFTRVACAFWETDDGSVWAVQNFQ
jgi:hypothetical protein